MASMPTLQIQVSTVLEHPEMSEMWDVSKLSAVKKKPLDIRISPYHCMACRYFWRKGTIYLPNLGFEAPESLINMEMFIQSITHEFMHKWLHEEISFGATKMWDTLDKALSKEKGRVVFVISEL
jgi:hypothetical protein